MEKEFTDIEKRHEEITMELVSNTQAINEIIKSKFKMPKDSIVKFPITLKNVTIHNFERDISHLIVEDNETNEFTIIVIYAHRDFDEECCAQEIGFDTPLLTEPRKDKEGKVVFMYWGHTTHFLILKCIPIPLKEEYLKLMTLYKQSKKRVKEHREWLDKTTSVEELQRKFSGEVSK